ncbi:MAG TPA: hypothetical protein VFY34_04495 [Pyrinomonadaceae bacterium]|nr:hypothetical protein [Pyrinomonadaceae bacterium]
MSDLGGGTALTNYEYENVLITFVSFYRLTVNPKELQQPENIGIDFDAAATLEPAKDLTATKDDFANSDGIATEVVTVRWTGRKCEVLEY